MFKRNLTKWIPLGNYTFGGTDFIVFVRGNTKTGMLFFKVKSVHPWKWFTEKILPIDLIDVRKQWEEINNLLNNAKH